MHESISEWTSIVQLVGFPLAILALFLGWRQLRAAVQTALVQNVLAIDARLSEFEDVRGQMNSAEPKIDLVRLRRYIAAFERIGTVLKYRGITLESADQFYGDRFARLIKYPAAMSIIKDRREAWEDFYYLWEELCSYKDNRRELSAPPAG